MNQILIGQLIMRQRKEKNLTQEQLAEKLNVSNKTISKWENGKCMPDYGIIESLCKALDITIAELMDGETNPKNSIRVNDKQQVLSTLERVQALEKHNNLLLGIMMICIGISLYAVSQLIHGTDARNVISGIMLGLSSGETLIGVYIVTRNVGRK